MQEVSGTRNFTGIFESTFYIFSIFLQSPGKLFERSLHPACQVRGQSCP